MAKRAGGFSAGVRESKRADAVTYITLLGSKCKSKEKRRHKNSSSQSEKRIVGINKNSSILSSTMAICKHVVYEQNSISQICTLG